MFPPGVKSVNNVEQTSCSLTFGLLASWSSGKRREEDLLPPASWPVCQLAGRHRRRPDGALQPDLRYGPRPHFSSESGDTICAGNH
jgi:hypothetical protein